MKHNIEIRELFWCNPEHAADLEKLEPLLQEQGVVIAHRHLAMVKVAIDHDDNDRIIGFAPFTMIPHTDGLWVAKEYRGGDLTHKLAESVSDFARDAAGGFMCVATSPFAEKLCREQKMEVFPGTVFVGRA